MPRDAPFLDPTMADPEPQLLPVQPRRGEVVEEQPKMVGDEIDGAHPEGRDGVAAIHPLAKAEEPARRRDFRAGFEGLGTHHGGEDFELRQFDTEIPAKQTAPGAAGKDDSLTGDAPLFGHRRRDTAALRFDAAHRALGYD